MTPRQQNHWIIGFEKRCNELGVDPEALYKYAQGHVPQAQTPTISNDTYSKIRGALGSPSATDSSISYADVQSRSRKRAVAEMARAKARRAQPQAQPAPQPRYKPATQPRFQPATQPRFQPATQPRFQPATQPR